MFNSHTQAAYAQIGSQPVSLLSPVGKPGGVLPDNERVTDAGDIRFTDAGDFRETE